MDFPQKKETSKEHSQALEQLSLVSLNLHTEEQNIPFKSAGNFTAAVGTALCLPSLGLLGHLFFSSNPCTFSELVAEDFGVLTFNFCCIQWAHLICGFLMSSLEHVRANFKSVFTSIIFHMHLSVSLEMPILNPAAYKPSPSGLCHPILYVHSLRVSAVFMSKWLQGQ